MNKSRGRPKGGSSGARDRLVAAAEDQFMERGYQDTSVRSIASAAGCDASLISSHFGSKAGLFAHVMTLSLDPASVLARALPGDPHEIGPRLLSHVLHVWGSPATAPSLGRLVTTAMNDPVVMAAFREYLDREVMTRLVEYFGGPYATDQATGLMTLVIGVVFGRFVMQVPTITTCPENRYLTVLAPAARAMTRHAARLPTPSQ